MESILCGRDDAALVLPEERHAFKGERPVRGLAIARDNKGTCS